MKIHNDLSPTNNGNPIDPALVLSHDRNLTDTKLKADEAAGRHRKAKQLAKTEGVDLDILKVIKLRAKHTAEDNIEWLNKVLSMSRTFMVAGLDKVAYQQVTAEAQDEEVMLKERFELGLLHGRQGLDPEFDLMDLATPAGQEYKKGHDRGMEEFANLQPILMNKMETPPNVSPDDPGVHHADDDDGDAGAAGTDGEAAPETVAAPEPEPKKKRGRPSKADLAKRAEETTAVNLKADAEAAFKPPVEAAPMTPSDDEEFAPRPAVEKAPAFLN